MRALSLCAAAVLVATTVSVSAQQPARGAQPRPRTPAAPAPRQAAPRPAVVPRKEAPVPFRVGETLTYDVAWSQFMVAGSAVSRVVEKRPSSNSSAYYIVAEGRPLPIISRIYALYYKMDSLMDSFTTLSHRASVYTEEGSAKRSASTEFDRNRLRAKVEWNSGAEPPRKEQIVVPQNVQDGLSTLYALRGRAFKAGDRVSIPVADNGVVYTATFEVSGPEPIRVPMGQMEAWKMGITIRDAANQQVAKDVAAWISTDARRLPVKLQAELPVGNFALTLRSAN